MFLVYSIKTGAIKSKMICEESLVKRSLEPETTYMPCPIGLDISEYHCPKGILTKKTMPVQPIIQTQVQTTIEKRHALLEEIALAKSIKDIKIVLTKVLNKIPLNPN